MNEALIANWNRVVGSDDLVYHLGDFGWGDCRPILERLGGRKVLVIGSHDLPMKNCGRFFEQMTPLLEIKHDNRFIVLCHYCLRVWARSHYNSWHLYGHSHGHLEPIGKSWDVGVDANGFAPVSLAQVETIMAARPDNPNLVRRGAKEHAMNEIIFLVEDAPEGGFTARALGESIFTESDSLPALHERIRDAVHCHYGEGNSPKLIRLHFVREEVLSV